MPQKKFSLAKNFLQQSSIYALGSGLASFFAFLFNLIAVRNVSQSLYGEYYSINSYVALLSVPLTVLQFWFVKNIGAQSDQQRLSYIQHTNRRVWYSVTQHLFLLSTIILLVVGWLLFGAHFLSPHSAWVTLIIFATNIIVTWLTSLLSGLQFFGVLSVCAIFSMLGRLVIGGGLLQIHNNLSMIYVTLLVVNFLAAAIYYLLTKNKIKNSLIAPASKKITPATREDKKDLWLSLGTTVITVCLLNLDVAAAKYFFDSATAGEYALFSLLAKVLTYATNPLCSVAYSEFARIKKRQDSRRLLWLASILISLFGMMMIFLYQAVPEFIITLVGTSDYLSLSSVLYWAAIFGTLYSLCQLWLQYSLARSHQVIILCVIFPACQLIGLAIFHFSSVTIMLVNVVVTSLLLLFLIWQNYAS